MAKRTAQSLEAEARFLKWAQDSGYTLHDFEWKGVKARYAATCAAGHRCSPMPNKVDVGESGCRPCGQAASAEKKGAAAKAAFLKWIADNGYTLHDFEWRGVMTTYPATCAAGHSCKPCPNAIQRGQGGCKPCGALRRAAAKSEASRLAFVSWAVDNGFTLVDTEWRGATVPHPAVCPEGHDCKPRPSDVVQGYGGCRVCAGKSWDAFYIVVGGGVLKFGVTSGDPSPRLRTHRRDGLDDLIVVRTGLPGTLAHDLENELRRLLDLAGVEPVRGREYFPAAVRNLVVSVAAEWLGT